ncbi:WD40-repeat-containing domain protein [Hygrophoropsis aurantiaca]|uniref:WD40-repeat-containing domain protein n=1 Tax=Hygrophoropsis aurantiaca TaxID=72124 RepID=A0ACB8A6F8_9AGAM|nr:WD40-repeat-containing domain protein [Hygrophoropsis aurantiaca]
MSTSVSPKLDKKSGSPLLIKTFKEDGHSVQSIACFKDGERIISGGLDCTVRMWDLENLQPEGEILMHGVAVWIVILSSDERKLLCFGGELILMWDLEDRSEVWRKNSRRLNGYRGNVAYSADGQLIAARHGKEIQLLNVETGDCIKELHGGNGGRVWALAFTNDGQQILALTPKFIRVWNTATGRGIGDPMRMNPESSAYGFIAMTPNGQRVATIGDLLQSGHYYTIFGLAWSCNSHSKSVVTGDTGGNIQLWDVSPLDSVSTTTPQATPALTASNPPLPGTSRPHANSASSSILNLPAGSPPTQSPELNTENSPHPAVHQMRRQYANPSDAERAVQKVIDESLQNVPLRLIDTATGHLCYQDERTNVFRATPDFKELISSVIADTKLNHTHITEVVKKYFRYAMLSHRWEGKEPLLRDVQNKSVYDLESLRPVTKLQRFCQTARDAGYNWAWSDTCCIDKTNSVKLQQSLNSMFNWYRYSSLTVVYLSDVPPSSKPGALEKSAWTTRGWTLQEFLAPNVIRFLRKIGLHI